MSLAHTCDREYSLKKCHSCMVFLQGRPAVAMTHARGVCRGAGAIARNEAPPRIVPIASLNSYQNHWTIKARITQKSDIKRYSNARGEGACVRFLRHHVVQTVCIPGECVGHVCAPLSCAVLDGPAEPALT